MKLTKEEKREKLKKAAHDHYSDMNRCGEMTSKGACNRSLGHGGGHSVYGKVGVNG
jgi:hypothetical protein